MRRSILFHFFGTFALIIGLNIGGCGNAGTQRTPAEQIEAAYRLSLDSLETVRNQMVLRHDSLLQVKKQWRESEGIIVAELGESGMKTIGGDSLLFAQYKTLIVDEFASLESVHNEIIIVYSGQINDARERENAPNEQAQPDERAFNARERYQYLLQLSNKEKETMKKVAEWKLKAREWLDRAKARSRPPMFGTPQVRTPRATTLN